MINPLLKMKFSLVLWYQGEANSHDPPNYACRFPAKITAWRELFNATLPYFYVELDACPAYSIPP